MTPSIAEFPPLRLVGLRAFGRLEELPVRVPPAWRELATRAPAIAGRLEPGIFYGAMPEAHHLGAPLDGVYIYWVAVRIAPDAPFPKGLGQLLIPAGRYAQATVAGTADQIDPTYLGLAGWMTGNGLTPVPDRWALERYDEARMSVVPPYERFNYEVLRPISG